MLCMLIFTQQSYNTEIIITQKWLVPDRHWYESVQQFQHLSARWHLSSVEDSHSHHRSIYQTSAVHSIDQLSSAALTICITIHLTTRQPDDSAIAHPVNVCLLFNKLQEYQSIWCLLNTCLWIWWHTIGDFYLHLKFDPLPCSNYLTTCQQNSQTVKQQVPW